MLRYHVGNAAAASLLAMLSQSNIASSLKILNGTQDHLFQHISISPACNTALDTELDCPPMVRGLTYPDHALSKNPSLFSATLGHGPAQEGEPEES